MQADYKGQERPRGYLSRADRDEAVRLAVMAAELEALANAEERRLWPHRNKIRAASLHLWRTVRDMIRYADPCQAEGMKRQDESMTLRLMRKKMALPEGETTVDAQTLEALTGAATGECFACTRDCLIC